MPSHFAHKINLNEISIKQQQKIKSNCRDEVLLRNAIKAKFIATVTQTNVFLSIVTSLLLIDIDGANILHFISIW